MFPSLKLPHRVQFVFEYSYKTLNPKPKPESPNMIRIYSSSFHFLFHYSLYIYMYIYTYIYIIHSSPITTARWTDHGASRFGRSQGPQMERYQAGLLPCPPFMVGFSNLWSRFPLFNRIRTWLVTVHRSRAHNFDKRVGY